MIRRTGPGVLFGEVSDAAGGGVATDSGVGSVVVVPVEPVGEGFLPLGLGGVGPGVGPFLEEGAVEAFDLAVGLRPPGPGPAWVDAQIAAEVAPGVLGVGPASRSGSAGRYGGSTRASWQPVVDLAVHTEPEGPHLMQAPECKPPCHQRAGTTHRVPASEVWTIVRDAHGCRLGARRVGRRRTTAAGQRAVTTSEPPYPTTTGRQAAPARVGRLDGCRHTLSSGTSASRPSPTRSRADRTAAELAADVALMGDAGPLPTRHPLPRDLPAGDGRSRPHFPEGSLTPWALSRHNAAPLLGIKGPRDDDDARPTAAFPRRAPAGRSAPPDSPASKGS